MDHLKKISKNQIKYKFILFFVKQTDSEKPFNDHLVKKLLF